jgi:hypothetical protein
MRSRTAETYGAAAQPRKAVYDAPPQDHGVEALICALPPPGQTMATPSHRQARMRDLDFALRSMLLTCPASDRLRALIEQLGHVAPEGPDGDRR